MRNAATQITPVRNIVEATMLSERTDKSFDEAAIAKQNMAAQHSVINALDVLELTWKQFKEWDLAK